MSLRSHSIIATFRHVKPTAQSISAVSQCINSTQHTTIDNNNMSKPSLRRAYSTAINIPHQRRSQPNIHTINNNACSNTRSNNSVNNIHHSNNSHQSCCLLCCRSNHTTSHANQYNAHLPMIANLNNIHMKPAQSIESPTSTLLRSSISQSPHRHFHTSPSLHMPPKAKGGKSAGPGSLIEPPPLPAYDPKAPIDVSFFQLYKMQTPPKLMKDAEYPEWIWDKTLQDKWTLEHFEQLDVDNLSPKLQKIYRKLVRKKKIWAHNAARREKVMNKNN